jgi:hypothetical protein
MAWSPLQCCLFWTLVWPGLAVCVVALPVCGVLDFVMLVMFVFLEKEVSLAFAFKSKTEQHPGLAFLARPPYKHSVQRQHRRIA